MSGVLDRYFLFFPTSQIEGDPSDLGLPFEEVFFVTRDDCRLHGWFVPANSNLTLLWFHGNAGNISHRLYILGLLRDALDVNVFLFDYRGYGRSTGNPSEKGLYRDAEAALDYLRSRPGGDHQKIIYFGQSLGSAVAVDLAARHPPAGLILEAAFPSVPDVASRLYPFLPARFLIRARFDSLSKIERINAPLLMAHGDRDDIIPLEAGQKLFEAAGGDKTFYVIRSAGHNDTFEVGGRDYLHQFRLFLQRLE
ncbi:MAG TPA: alpha/beta hydrolase [Dehalococcoidales bacterium]|nr:alpha/beta hydrolase [Dehalococcoidales bacterium]